jgi:hypothetical protein
MSNVLIGIIGVILFIGLALAGALILGDDFRSATNETQAAAAVSQLQQVKAAVDMWKLKTGQSTIMNQNTAFLTPRFLKIPAVNPTKAGRANASNYQYATRFNNDVCPDGGDEAGVVASHIMIPVGNDAAAGAICQAIADQHSQGVMGSDIRPTSPIGCVRIDAQPQCGYSGIWYMAYATV